MSQHDHVIDNQTAANLRADVNLALAAIASNNSGASAPTTTFPFMWWADTANNKLKIRNEADSAWIEVADIDGSFEANVNAEYLKADTDDLLTAGYAATADNHGTQSSGTYTPTYAGGNMKRIVNGGAFTFAAPTASGDYTLIIQVTNNASAGTMTFSGFTITPDGDALTTTNGDKFFVYITKLNGSVTATVKALQ